MRRQETTFTYFYYLFNGLLLSALSPCTLNVFLIYTVTLVSSVFVKMEAILHPGVCSITAETNTWVIVANDAICTLIRIANVAIH